MLIVATERIEVSDSRGEQFAATTNAVCLSNSNAEHEKA